MGNLPNSIAITLKNLRASHRHYVSVKKIRGGYYAFEVTSKWDPTTKKNRTLTDYLGAMKRDGTFVTARHREKKVQDQTKLIFDEIEEKILLNLSMNGRITIPKLAVKLSLSNTATRYRIQKIEHKYGIQYITPLEPTKYGYTTYIAFVKFKDKVPNSNLIKAVLESEGRIQLVLLTKGHFDIMIALLATGNRDVIYLTDRLKTETVFKDYESEWFVSPRYNIFGIVPIRAKFFELLERQVWKRTKYLPRPEKGNLTYREFAVLKELNDNGNADFIYIDKKYGLKEGTAQYTYYGLIDDGALSRVTITMSKPPIKYNAIILMKVLNGGEFDNARIMAFEEIIKSGRGPTNRFTLVSEILTPFGIIFIFPVYEEEDLIELERVMQDKIDGIEIQTTLVSATIVGNLCYSRFDNKDPTNYTILTKKYGINKGKKENADYEKHSKLGW